MTWSRRCWILGVTSALLLGACGLPTGSSDDPEGAYYLWLHARDTGSLDEGWEVLHPEIHDLLARWHEAEQDTRFVIESMYPEPRQASAIAALEVGGRARLPDAKALYAHLLTRGAEEPLSGLQQVSARIASVECDEESGTLETFGGDVVSVKRADDASWAVTLSPEPLERLQALVDQAESNLRRAKQNVKRLRGVDDAGQSEQSGSPSGQ